MLGPFSLGLLTPYMEPIYTKALTVHNTNLECAEVTVTSRVTSFLVSCPSSVLSWDLTAVPALFSLPNSRGGKDSLSSPGGPGSRRSNYNLGMSRGIWKNLDDGLGATAPGAVWRGAVRYGGWSSALTFLEGKLQDGG